MNPFIKWVLLYVLTLVLFLLIDLCWLGWLAKDLYKKQLGHLMTDRVNWTAALIFYCIFIAALLFFVIQPAIEKKDLVFALFSGAFFGLVTYATYDLTNMATLKAWPDQIVYIDICWGMFLCTVVSGGGYYLHKWIIG